MRFQTKLLIYLLSALFLCTAAILSLFVYYSYQTILREMRAKVLSIAATGATQIDGDLHRQIRTRDDEKSEAYHKLRQQLRAIRDTNRRDDTYVQYVYTIIKSPDNPQVNVFAIDAEESPEDVSHVGDSIHHTEVSSWQLGHTEVAADIVRDQWGNWLSAHAPIKDSKGEIVGALVADIPERRIKKEYSLILTKSLLAIGIGIIIFLVSALLIARKVTTPLARMHSAVERITGGDLSINLKETGIIEFDEVSNALEQMTAGLREREMVKSAFARYVSHQVVDSILKKGEAPVLHGERRRITVLFCDIRGFTTMSERLRPEAVVAILNDYFEKVLDIVFKYNGTLDKFIGDGLMAIFGAPAEDADQEEHAIRAAMEIKKALSDVAQKVNLNHDMSFGIGIGINSGVAIVGNIGSSQRMEYTAIGDTVNLASRLESKTRELNEDILISEDTFNAVRGIFPGSLNKVGSITVKGRENAVIAYAVKQS